MNWGTRIFFSFVVFAGIIITMVVISINNPSDLVESEPYMQGINYDEQIERERNYNQLENPPEITYDRAAREFTLQFPEDMSPSVTEGSIYFYRPSGASQDLTVDLQLNEDGNQSVDLAGKTQGKWYVKLSWKARGLEYYVEKALVL